MPWHILKDVYIYVYIYMVLTIYYAAAQRLVGPCPKPGVALVGLGTQDLAMIGKILFRMWVVFEYGCG